jgi:hypothetical protein
MLKYALVAADSMQQDMESGVAKLIDAADT